MAQQLSLGALFLACAGATAEGPMGCAQCRVDGTGGGDGLNPLIDQLLPRIVADHGGDDRPAATNGLDNGHELVFPEGMPLVEGTVLFDGDLLEEFRLSAVIVVNQEALGMAEVLVDLGPGFGCNGDTHDLLHSFFTTKDTKKAKS